MWRVKQAQNSINRPPIASVAELPEYDAIIFGTPTRFGNMCAQMRNFLDQTGGLWAKGRLIGKAGSVFTSTATQPRAARKQPYPRSTTALLHHGMVVVGTQLLMRRSCAHERNHRRISLRSRNARGKRWEPGTFGKRNQDCSLPGRSCSRHCQKTSLLGRASGL